MDETVSYHFATVKQRRENRHEIDYQLTLRQQPKQSRMCGVGEKADRRPIDPPPIVQLKVFDSSLPAAEKNSYLQNPYYFMYASLMAADLDEELHLLRDGKTRSTTGSVVSSLYHLKDIDNTDAGFFVFPDLSVRMEGSYRLKLSLFEIIGKEVFHCRSIISNKFFVYSAKKFPGMEESTFLSRSFADQGLKIRIRKELRQRRKLSKLSDLEENGSDTSATNTNPTSNNSSSNMTAMNTTPPSSTSTGTKKSHGPGGKRARVNHNEDTRQASWTSPMAEHNTRFYSTAENSSSVIDRQPYYEHQQLPHRQHHHHQYESDVHHGHSHSGSGSSSHSGGYTTQAHQPMEIGHTSPNVLHTNPFTSPYRSTRAPIASMNNNHPNTTSTNTNNTPSNQHAPYFYHQNGPPTSTPSPSSHHLPTNSSQLPPPPAQPHPRY